MELVIFACVVIAGFVASACLYHADGLLRGGPVSFEIQSTSLVEMLSTFIFCMFAGPYIVATQGGRLWWNRQIPAHIFGMGLGVVMLWSFCAGVFVAQALSMTGLINT